MTGLQLIHTRTAVSHKLSENELCWSCYCDSAVSLYCGTQCRLYWYVNFCLLDQKQTDSLRGHHRLTRLQIRVLEIDILWKHLPNIKLIIHWTYKTNKYIDWTKTQCSSIPHKGGGDSPLNRTICTQTMLLKFYPSSHNLFGAFLIV